MSAPAAMPSSVPSRSTRATRASSRIASGQAEHAAQAPTAQASHLGPAAQKSPEALDIQASELGPAAQELGDGAQASQLEPAALGPAQAARDAAQAAEHSVQAAQPQPAAEASEQAGPAVGGLVHEGLGNDAGGVPASGRGSTGAVPEEAAAPKRGRGRPRKVRSLLSPCQLLIANSHVSCVWQTA